MKDVQGASPNVWEDTGHSVTIEDAL